MAPDTFSESRRDPQRTRRRIIAEATAEFAERGFSRARVDDIAARTATTKRMIYYYFGSKERLFTEVLTQALASSALSLPDEDPSDPVSSIRSLVRRTFERDEQHPERVRLLSVANIHDGRHLADAPGLHATAGAIVDWLATVLRHGQEQGLFRAHVDPLDLLTVVSAMSDYRVSHRASVQVVCDRDMLDPATRERQQEPVSYTHLTLPTICSV